MVDDETILRDVEQQPRRPRQGREGARRAANKGGGEDNITVVFFEIGGDEDGARGERTLALPPVEQTRTTTPSTSSTACRAVAVTSGRDENGARGPAGAASRCSRWC